MVVLGISAPSSEHRTPKKGYQKTRLPIIATLYHFPIFHFLSYKKCLDLLPFSKRLSHLPRLPPPRDRIHKLLPADGMHLVSRLTQGHDDAELVAGGADVVRALVAQTDHHATHDVADSKAICYPHAVFFRCAHVL